MSKQCIIADRKCQPCEGGVMPLDEANCRGLLADLDDWSFTGRAIEKTFHFPDHHAAMAFVNAVAWISHREDHHPEITLGYADVLVRYWTHALAGLSENDFICAAKVDRLFSL